MHPLEFVDVVILALVEGVAGILPVDASGHAVLLSWLTGWKAASITVAIELGTLLALLLWLWRDILLICQGLWKLRKARIEPGTRLLAKALVASVPWILADSFFGEISLGLVAVGILTVLCALIMGAIDSIGMTVKRIEHLSPLGAAGIGLIQVLALLPGVGRVPMALVMTRLIGLERPAAYRFVLLASIPVLLVSSVRHAVAYTVQGITPSGGDLLAVSLSFTLVLLAITLANAWIRRAGLMPFALYRLALGVLMIWLGAR